MDRSNRIVEIEICMAKSSQFSYRQSDFFLFRMDVRCKLISISTLSVSTSLAVFPDLLIVCAVLFWLMYRSGVSFNNFFKEIRFFLLMLMVIFFIRVLVYPATPLDIFGHVEKYLPGNSRHLQVLLSYIRVSREGMVDGAIVVLRFFVIMLLGLLFSVSTKASDLRSSVSWFFKPIPFIPEKRVGVMVSLFVRFLPLVLEKVSEVSDAQKSRCVHMQKNPIKRLKNMSLPLLKKVFVSADTLACAMASRCYNEEVDNQTFLKSGHETYFYIIIISYLLFNLFYRSEFFLH